MENINKFTANLIKISVKELEGQIYLNQCTLRMAHLSTGKIAHTTKRWKTSSKSKKTHTFVSLKAIFKIRKKIIHKCDSMYR